MKITDITGPIYEGMWNYEPPFPKFRMKPLGKIPWVDDEVFCEIFEGLHSQTGTYLETPAHFYGNSRSYLVSDIPVERLIDIPCVVLKLENIYSAEFEGSEHRKPVTAEMLKACEAAADIPEDSAILVSTGWGIHWMEADFLTLSPYFTYDAMRWLISCKPFLIGADVPRWENLDRPQGFFPDFYAADILMLAPCVNLDRISANQCRLTVLPLNIRGTSCVPCRAVVIEEDE